MTMINRENAGKTIELLSLDDPRSDLKPGMRGTIVWERHDGFSNTVAVNWSNGSTLSLLEGIDRYRIL